MKKQSKLLERAVGALGMGWLMGSLAVSLGVAHPSSVLIALLGMVMGFLIGGEVEQKEYAE